MIELFELSLVGKGGERNVYIYPNDSSKIIKVLKKNAKHNNQNLLEYKYMKYLESKKLDISHLTKCYGFVNTNLGEGLVFDRVMDYDNTPSKSFRFMVAHKLIEEGLQLKLLEELKNYLEDNKILFVDNSMTNIFYQKTSEDNGRLIIVDGLGAKRDSVKFWLYLKLPIYRDYKIKKQWRKLMKLYNKDIRRIKDGTMPMHRL